MSPLGASSFRKLVSKPIVFISSSSAHASIRERLKSTGYPFTSLVGTVRILSYNCQGWQRMPLERNINPVYVSTPACCFMFRSTRHTSCSYRVSIALVKAALDSYRCMSVCVFFFLYLYHYLMAHHDDGQ